MNVLLCTMAIQSYTEDSIKAVFLWWFYKSTRPQQKYQCMYLQTVWCLSYYCGTYLQYFILSLENYNHKVIPVLHTFLFPCTEQKLPTIVKAQNLVLQARLAYSAKMGKTNERKKQSPFDAKPIQDGIYSIERLVEANIYWRSWDRFRQMPWFQMSV